MFKKGQPIYTWRHGVKLGKLNATLVSDNPMTQIKKPGASVEDKHSNIEKKSKALYLDLYGVSQIGRARDIKKKREQNEDKGERENDEGRKFWEGGRGR